MTLEPNGNAPYGPAKTIIEVVERFRDRGLPAPIDGDVLTRAGISESVIPKVLRSLEGLSLIDDAGNPTDAFLELQKAPSPEFKPRFQELLRAVYAPIFEFTNPADDSPQAITDAFRGFTPVSQRDRMVMLFLNLCEYAEIIDEVPRKKPGRRPKTDTSGSKVGVVHKSKKKRDASKRNRPAGFDGSDFPPAIEGLLHHLPSNLEWTQGQRDAFVEAFVTILDYTYKVIRDQEEESE